MMMKRNGFHRYMWVVLLLCLGPVKAEDSVGKDTGKSVDDIVAMMGWWDEYGRYWDEMDVIVGTDEEMTFALLEGQGSQRQEAVQ